MKIYNLIILDESGSMSSIRKQAIDGFNETVQTIKAAAKKHAEQQHFVSLVTFNGAGIKTVYDKTEVAFVHELNDELYNPDCDTPLYDAMGKSLTELKKSVNTEDKVLVTIITDGYENASREYNQPAIKALVEELKAKGWVFTYIGANQDVEQMSATISVTNVMSFQATETGTSEMFLKERSSRARYYDAVANESDESLQGRFFDEEELFGQNQKGTLRSDNSESSSSGEETTSLEECLYQMAACHQNGDSEGAYTWGEKAANKGSALAMHFIGNMFFYENFRPINKASVDFLQKAIQNNGVVMPWDMMGKDEYEPDYRSAYKWFLRGAEHGNADSMTNVGNLLYTGCGCEKDVEKAKYWLQKAMNKGNEYAEKAYQAYFGNADQTLPVKSDKEYSALLAEFEDCANKGLAKHCDELRQELITGTDKQLARWGYIIAKGKYNIGGLYEKFDYPVRKDGEPFLPVIQFRGEYKSFVRINLDAFDEENPIFCFTCDLLCFPIEPLKWITIEGGGKYETVYRNEATLTYTSGEFGWLSQEKKAILLKPDRQFCDESAIDNSGVSKKVAERIKNSAEAWFIDHGEKEYSVEICQIKDGQPIILYRYTIDGWDQGNRVSKAEIIYNNLN